MMKNLKRQNHSENLITAPNKSASRIELSRTDVKVLAPSRLVLGGGLVVFEWSARKSCAFAQKNFREDENLFFRSVTGLAILGTARGHCIESAEDAPGRTSLPHCNVGCA